MGIESSAMFHAFRGPLDDKFLTDELDPSGTKRSYRSEMDLFGSVSVPEATFSENEEIEITVELRLTDEFVRSLRDRYRDLFETSELEEMADVAGDFINELRETAERMEPDDESGDAYGRLLGQHAIIATSIAIAQSLQRLFRETLDDRAEIEAANGPGDARDEFEEDRSFLSDEDGMWPEPDNDDEVWDIGTVMDADGVIPNTISASAIGDDDKFASNADSIVFDENILAAAMDARVNAAEVVQSFDAIQEYLDGEIGVQHGDKTDTAYQKTLKAFMHALKTFDKGTVSLRRLLEFRADPVARGILSSLKAEEAKCCFANVFHNVAEAALYEVEEFFTMVDARVDRSQITFDYADELVQRHLR
jgi:hypothetical protein